MGCGFRFDINTFAWSVRLMLFFYFFFFFSFRFLSNSIREIIPEISDKGVTIITILHKHTDAHYMKCECVWADDSFNAFFGFVCMVTKMLWLEIQMICSCNEEEKEQSLYILWYQEEYQKQLKVKVQTIYKKNFTHLK